MVTIGIDQSLSNSVLYEHRCLENIKKLYKSASKYYDKKKYKNILESDMVSTTEVFTDNIPMSLGLSVSPKNTRARKSFYQFTEVLYVKHKTAAHRLGDAKSKRKSIISGSML